MCCRPSDNCKFSTPGWTKPQVAADAAMFKIARRQLRRRKNNGNIKYTKVKKAMNNLRKYKNKELCTLKIKLNVKLSVCRTHDPKGRGPRCGSFFEAVSQLPTSKSSGLKLLLCCVAGACVVSPNMLRRVHVIFQPTLCHNIASIVPRTCLALYRRRV